MTARQPSKEVVARRAVAAATRARPAPRGHRADGQVTAPLRASAGLALTATGLICALAVHVHSRALNVQTAGIIVTALGLAWLWIPVRNKRALLRRQFDRAMRYLAWIPVRAALCAAPWRTCLKPATTKLTTAPRAKSSSWHCSRLGAALAQQPAIRACRFGLPELAPLNPAGNQIGSDVPDLPVGVLRQHAEPLECHLRLVTVLGDQNSLSLFDDSP